MYLLQSKDDFCLYKSIILYKSPTLHKKKKTPQAANLLEWKLFSNQFNKFSENYSANDHNHWVVFVSQNCFATQKQHIKILTTIPPGK
ncbi:hypothetical protein GCM10007389_07640 [Pontibacter akesuensis]|nr:hypothetical protein GCM10007389_07640 [Pontibacter akesuensis]